MNYILKHTNNMTFLAKPEKPGTPVQWVSLLGCMFGREPEPWLFETRKGAERAQGMHGGVVCETIHDEIVIEDTQPECDLYMLAALQVGFIYDSSDLRDLAR